MPFIWNNNPNAPARELPQAVPPGEVSYEVALVANTVNVGGALSYNTANFGYDVVYELASLNVDSLNVRSLNSNLSTGNVAESANGPLYFTVARARASISNTSPINYDSNTGIISHALSGVVAGTYGGANTIPVVTLDDKGHVVGVTNTSISFPSTGNSLQGIRNLWIETHPDDTLGASHLLLHYADEIVMDDGEVIRNWEDLTANVGLTGAGGIDIGSESSSVWYEVYAIRNSSTSIKTLLLHRALDRSMGTTTVVARTGVLAFRNSTLGVLKLAQGFRANGTGLLTGCDLSLTKVGSPTGYVWVTVHDNDGSDNASNTVLSTSNLVDLTRLSSINGARLRFVFPNPPSIAAGSDYFFVVNADNVLNASDYILPFGSTTINYTPGRFNKFLLSTNNWRTAANAGDPVNDLYFNTFVEANGTAVTLPTGYDQKSLISYVYNDVSGNFRAYSQRDRTMSLGLCMPWQLDLSDEGGDSDVPLNIVPIDVSGVTPPVTCLVSFIAYCPTIGGVLWCGGLKNTNLPPAAASLAQVALQVPGISVVTIPSAGFSVTSPIVVEQQVVLMKASSTTITLNVFASLVTF